jgi:hypothetical protein
MQEQSTGAGCRVMVRGLTFGTRIIRGINAANRAEQQRQRAAIRAHAAAERAQRQEQRWQEAQQRALEREVRALGREIKADGRGQPPAPTSKLRTKKPPNSRGASPNAKRRSPLSLAGH